MADADVRLWRSTPVSASADALFEQLHRETPWQEEDVVLFGKRYRQPRLLAWYGDPGAHYTYSGVAHEPLPWTACLSSLRATVEALTDHTYNSVLLNLYRDHRDSMGMHADDEVELGEAPVIASLSLGEERTFVLRHQYDKAVPTVRVPLPSGSLLLMAGATQRYWKHGINKLRHPCGARINLTFRTILPGAT